MPLSFPSPLPLQHETAVRGKMSKAVTVRTTGFLEFLCKILVLTKQLMQDDLCLWILPIDFNSTGHETAIMLSGSMVFGKNQIEVSERSSAQFVLWAAWGLSAYFPRSSPSSWNKQEFVGTALGQPRERPITALRAPGSFLSSLHLAASALL